MKKKNIFTLIFFLSWFPGFSCSCGSAGNFIEATKEVDLIVLIKVKEYQDFFTLRNASPSGPINQPLSARVEVIKVLQGEEQRKEISIFGDNGALCRPYIDIFKKEQYYIIGLYKEKNGKKGEDYFVSICGEHWLDYDEKNKTVKGRIKANRRKLKVIPISELQDLLTKS